MYSCWKVKITEKPTRENGFFWIFETLEKSELSPFYIHAQEAAGLGMIKPEIGEHGFVTYRNGRYHFSKEKPENAKEISARRKHKEGKSGGTGNHL